MIQRLSPVFIIIVGKHIMQSARKKSTSSQSSPMDLDAVLASKNTPSQRKTLLSPVGMLLEGNYVLFSVCGT